MKTMARQLMRRIKGARVAGPTLGLAALFMLFVVSGCRVEDRTYVPVYSAQMLSDQTTDGDISLSLSGDYYVSSALNTGDVLVGVDPVYGDEFRGFLNFDLRGAPGVPWNADIESATLEIFIDGVNEPYPGAGVPLVVDLVSYVPATLSAADFHRSYLPPLRSLFVDIYAHDTGAMVVIDVTDLVVEAQYRGLYDFQLRLSLDGFADSGLVDIDDDAADTAPLLTVFYY